MRRDDSVPPQVLDVDNTFVEIDSGLFQFLFQDIYLVVFAHCGRLLNVIWIQITDLQLFGM